MRYQDLTEAPIGDFEYKTDTDEPVSFAQKDINLLKSLAHVERVRKAFSKTPYIFDLYFLNLSNFRMQPDVSSGSNSIRPSDDFLHFIDEIAGETSVTKLNKMLSTTYPRVKIKRNLQSITCAYFSNADVTTRHPLTPWIIAHRFGHALVDGDLNKNISPTLENTIIDLKSILHRVIRLDEVTKLRLDDLLTMKSAGKLTRSEFIPELIAQYLITGKVTLKIHKKYSEFDNISEKNLIVQGYEDAINSRIKNILDHCVGKLFASA